MEELTLLSEFLSPADKKPPPKVEGAFLFITCYIKVEWKLERVLQKSKRTGFFFPKVRASERVLYI